MEVNKLDKGEYEEDKKEIDLHAFERPIRSDIFRKSWDQVREKKWHTRHNKGEEIHELMWQLQKRLLIVAEVYVFRREIQV